MPVLTTYAYRDSFVFRLDPRVKVAWLAVMLLLSVTTSRPALLAGYLLVILAAAAVGGVSFARLWPTARAMISVAAVIVVIQLLLHPGPHPLLQLGGLRFYREGLPIGLEVALRIYCIVLASLLTFIWMDPTTLTLLLLKLGLNYRYAMLVSLSLRTFPLLERELGKIYDSQQARGMELRGTLRKLIRLLPVMMPFVLRALRRSNEIAVSMELRGFGYKKQRTWQRAIALRASDRVALTVLATATVAYAAIRLARPRWFL
ncbi:MAG: energy-coupling factor transporter transmembrane protein EcfT [Candidatus Dormibacteraeota bacterium]|nr:energy-coupling factor transporter transmembrane protein EcfT [Candidatus Dormibacteraeota bacterium]